MDRKLFTSLLAVFFIINVLAQSPQKISYQAVVRTADNNLLVNQTIGMRVSILRGSAYGSVIYQETYSTNPKTNVNGLVTLSIGTGTAAVGSFETIAWSSGAYFIKVEIDPEGSTNYTITSTSQLLSVPYAFYATTAGNGFSGSYADLTDKPKGTNIGDIQYWDGTAWVMVPGGQPGQYLQLTASKTPAWTGNSYPVIAGTSAVSSIERTTAVCGGSITSNGGLALTARGVCWSTSENPTIADNKTTDGTETGDFTSSLTGLTSGVTYYVRAYATNSMGTAYGKQVSFTTVIGHVSYTLSKVANPTATEQAAYNLITAAMDSAVWYYNHYTTFTKVLYVSYNTGVATADGSNSGSIRFGANTSYMQKATAMHEIAHTLGVGQNSSWTAKLMINGLYTGAKANAVYLSTPNPTYTCIHGDGMHFWPYGLNYESEYKSTADLIYHCKILEAMKEDGL
jgi:hypothetical protein